MSAISRRASVSLPADNEGTVVIDCKTLKGSSENSESNLSKETDWKDVLALSNMSGNQASEVCLEQLETNLQKDEIAVANSEKNSEDFDVDSFLAYIGEPKEESLSFDQVFSQKSGINENDTDIMDLLTDKASDFKMPFNDLLSLETPALDSSNVESEKFCNRVYSPKLETAAELHSSSVGNVLIDVITENHTKIRSVETDLSDQSEAKSQCWNDTMLPPNGVEESGSKVEGKQNVLPVAGAMIENGVEEFFDVEKKDYLIGNQLDLGLINIQMDIDNPPVDQIEAEGNKEIPIVDAPEETSISDEIQKIVDDIIEEIFDTVLAKIGLEEMVEISNEREQEASSGSTSECKQDVTQMEVEELPMMPINSLKNSASSKEIMKVDGKEPTSETAEEIVSSIINEILVKIVEDKSSEKFFGMHSSEFQAEKNEIECIAEEIIDEIIAKVVIIDLPIENVDSESPTNLSPTEMQSFAIEIIDSVIEKVFDCSLNEDFSHDDCFENYEMAPLGDNKEECHSDFDKDMIIREILEDLIDNSVGPLIIVEDIVNEILSQVVPYDKMPFVVSSVYSMAPKKGRKGRKKRKSAKLTVKSMKSEATKRKNALDSQEPKKKRMKKPPSSPQRKSTRVRVSDFVIKEEPIDIPLEDLVEELADIKPDLPPPEVLMQLAALEEGKKKKRGRSRWKPNEKNKPTPARKLDIPKSSSPGKVAWRAMLQPATKRTRKTGGKTSVTKRRKIEKKDPFATIVQPTVEVDPLELPNPTRKRKQTLTPLPVPPPEMKRSRRAVEQSQPSKRRRSSSSPRPVARSTRSSNLEPIYIGLPVNLHKRQRRVKTYSEDSPPISERCVTRSESRLSGFPRAFRKIVEDVQQPLTKKGRVHFTPDVVPKTNDWEDEISNKSDEDTWGRALEGYTGDLANLSGRKPSLGLTLWPCTVRLERSTCIDRLLPNRKQEETIFCELCEPKRLFLSKNALVEHLKTDHVTTFASDTPEPVSDRCPGCDKKYHSQNRLVGHMNICPAFAKLRDDGSSHQNRAGQSSQGVLRMALTSNSSSRQLEAEQRHVCETCGEKFTLWTAFESHKRIHWLRQRSEQDPLKLDEMEVSNNYETEMARRGKGLKMTIRRSEPRVFRCDTCNAPFDKAETLKKHKLTHLVRVKQERVSPEIEILEEYIAPQQTWAPSETHSPPPLPATSYSELSEPDGISTAWEPPADEPMENSWTVSSPYSATPYSEQTNEPAEISTPWETNEQTWTTSLTPSSPVQLSESEQEEIEHVFVSKKKKETLAIPWESPKSKATARKSTGGHRLNSKPAPRSPSPASVTKTVTQTFSQQQGSSMMARAASLTPTQRPGPASKTRNATLTPAQRPGPASVTINTNLAPQRPGPASKTRNATLTPQRPGPASVTINADLAPPQRPGPASKTRNATLTHQRPGPASVTINADLAPQRPGPASITRTVHITPPHRLSPTMTTTTVQTQRPGPASKTRIANQTPMQRPGPASVTRNPSQTLAQRPGPASVTRTQHLGPASITRTATQTGPQRPGPASATRTATLTPPGLASATRNVSQVIQDISQPTAGTSRSKGTARKSTGGVSQATLRQRQFLSFHDST